MKVLLVLCGLFVTSLLAAQDPIIGSAPPEELLFGPRETMPLLLVDECTELDEYERKVCVEKYMRAYLYNHLRWPSTFCGGGMVVISFYINNKGIAENPVITRGIHEVIDQESLRVVQELITCYLWQPATQLGRPVKVLYHMPVRWRLE